ncbi:MAG: hypothetical protein K0S93_177 [Nitrososphaeraceae archaeon]|jgi:hypothetical protein|nr:hypothetical protein [Nitrososphaeraceae archaeon]
MPRHSSPIDWKKVMEGRAILSDPDLKDATNTEKMFYLFDHRPDLLEGLSINEIALILFPNETVYDKKRKRTLPDRFAYNKAARYVQLLNSWVLNKSHVINASVDRQGQWRLFNKQKMKDFADTEKHENDVLKGIQNIQDRKKSIIRLSIKSKEKNASATRGIIKRNAIDRKRKRRRDDNNE